MRLAGSPEIPGGQATAALAVNLVPRVLEASPGLKAMTDLPVPAAIMGPSTVTERRSDHAQGPQRLVPRGTWVELQREVLAPGERAPQVPEETGAVPLELRVKGFLVADSALGEEAEVRTPAGRRLSGTLDRALPAYEHGFGPPVPELLEVGAELRALLREGRDE